jgi:putative protein kinase ArgK-like GTPase of G3E family
MNSFKLFSIGCKMLFLSQISAFFYSVAQLCSSKKSKFGIKTTIFRFNQKSLNEFNNQLTNITKIKITNNYFQEKRKSQNQYWMMETINEQLKNSFYHHPEIIKLLGQNKKAVANDEISPFAAAQLLLKKYSE